LLLLPLLLTAGARGEQACDQHDPLRRPFFGDLHIHTRHSLDASTQGTLTTPDQAYAFAKGAALGIQPWLENGKAARSIQLDRPLDFAMVSDHAELFGETSVCTDQTHPQFNAWQCRMYRRWPRLAYYWFNYWSAMEAERVGFCGEEGEVCLVAATGTWRTMQDAAAAHDDPSSACAFTTFVGYEWTGGFVGDASGNIHRNVVFRSAKVPPRAISFIEQPSAEKLYAALDASCIAAEGCEAIVIPHNSNLSAGIMFPLQQPDGSERTPGINGVQARYERLAEIMQHKGASECYFGPLDLTDELCAFERLPERSFTDSSPPGPADGFLRRVLGEGLQQGAGTGTNPFAFGFIGSTDTHLGAAGAVDEQVFLGHGGAGLPAGEQIPEGLPDLPAYNPGGLAVLWAEENSRDALFDAMRRREAYATSGPRMVVRTFGGWKFDAAMCSSENLVNTGYAEGVPMGGELVAPATDDAAPVFVVQALRDSAGPHHGHGMPLERIQIIKGTLQAGGDVQTAVIEIARDDGDVVVDPATCAIRGQGAATLCTVWRDPDFDAAERAFYYARVLEYPVCRWSQRMCVAAGVDCARGDTIGTGFEGCCAADHQPTIQERAWTSPIWYSPVQSPAHEEVVHDER
jgi:hypothetical protein